MPGLLLLPGRPLSGIHEAGTRVRFPDLLIRTYAFLDILPVGQRSVPRRVIDTPCKRRVIRRDTDFLKLALDCLCDEVGIHEEVTRLPLRVCGVRNTLPGGQPIFL